MMEWIVSSSLLILVIAALRFLLKGRISLRLQYGLWAFVLVRLLVPFSFGSTPVSVMNTALEVPAVQDAVLLSGIDEIELKDGGVVEGYQSGPVAAAAPIPVANGKSEAEFSRMKTVLHARETFTAVWSLGSVLMFLVFAASNVAFRRKLKQGRMLLPAAPDALPVYLSASVETPCLFGLFQPCIYLTPAAVENPTTMRHAVEHEMTHFHHGDHIWSVMRCVCLILHWYNPLVWLAVVLSRRDAELACDESTLLRLGEGERKAYGNTLIDLTCEKRTAAVLFRAATTMAGSRSGIRERITLIAKKPKTLWVTAVAAALIAAAAVGCTFTGAEKEGPWTWSKELKTSDIRSVVILDSGSELFSGETEELVSLLNGMEKSDYTEDKQPAGGTPTHGLKIETNSGTYYLSESVSQDGTLELHYGEKQWQIYSEALSALVGNAAALVPTEEIIDTVDGVPLLDDAYARALLLLPEVESTDSSRTLSKDDAQRYPGTERCEIEFPVYTPSDPALYLIVVSYTQGEAEGVWIFEESKVLRQYAGDEPDGDAQVEDDILLTGFSVKADGGMEEIGQAWAEAFVSQYVNSLSRENPRYSTDAAVLKCTPYASSVSVHPKRLIFQMSFVCNAADPAAFEQSYAGWAGPLSDERYPQYSGWMNFGWYVELELTDSSTWTCMDAGTGGYGGWGYLNYEEAGEAGFRIEYMLRGEIDTPENLLRVLPFVDWAALDADSWEQLYSFLDQYCLTEGQVYGPEATRMWKDVYPSDQEYRDMYVILTALHADGAYAEGLREILKKQADYDPALFEACIEENLTAEQREIILSLMNI